MGDRVLPAVNDALGDYVLQLLLDAPAQVPGAVGGGVGLFDQIAEQALVPGEGDVLLSQGVLQFLKHERRNILEVVLGELVEVDDLVHPVNKLGPQEVLQVFRR